MWNTKSGSTGRLIQLCIGYFAAYVLTGISVKYFTSLRVPKLTDISYLTNNTLGGSVFALLIVFLFGWVAMKSNRRVRVAGVSVPIETVYIIPSGICTAVVIPTTTLMYTLPISVMVAMVIMRGSVIVISRIVDAVQIRQGILKKRVYAEENWAVAFALLAVGANVLWTPHVQNAGIDLLRALGFRHLQHVTVAPGKGGFEFLQSTAAMVIMGAYAIAYTIRIYIMNFFKNTRAKGVELDNRGFFAIEQIAAFATMVAVGLFLFSSPSLLGWADRRILDYRGSITHLQIIPVLSGIPFGIVAFFSVFIFMFKGRTATFAGLVNRLTSLLAGTTATLLTALFFKTKMPTVQEWVGLCFIFVAVYFLTRAEKRRVKEVAPEVLAEAVPAPRTADAEPVPATAGAGGS